MPTWDNLIAQAQELVDDVVEDVPGAKGAWTIGDRYLSARKLRAIVDQGRERLHDAAQVLTDKEAKAALEGISEYITLLKDHSKLDATGTELRKMLDSLKFYQVMKKYSIRVDAMQFRAESHSHQREVQELSDRARLGLNPRDGTLSPHIGRLGHGLSTEGTRVLELCSEQTLVAHVQDRSLPDTPGTSRHSSSADRLDEPSWNGAAGGDIVRLADLLEHAETHSIIGNPWAEDEYRRSCPVINLSLDILSDVVYEAAH